MPAGWSISCRALAAELVWQTDILKQTELPSWRLGSRPDMKYVKHQNTPYVE